MPYVPWPQGSQVDAGLVLAFGMIGDEQTAGQCKEQEQYSNESHDFHGAGEQQAFIHGVRSGCGSGDGLPWMISYLLFSLTRVRYFWFCPMLYGVAYSIGKTAVILSAGFVGVVSSGVHCYG